MDRLTAMQVFVEVAEKGSVSAAAAALGMSRAMATRHLHYLESWLNVRLLHRTTRRISLSEAGQECLLQCQRMLELAGEVRGQSGKWQAEPQGEVRVATSTSFAVEQLSRAISEFVTRYPKARVNILTTDSTINLVEERVDMAVRITNNLDAGFISRKLSVCRSVLCATPAYLTKHGVPQKPEDLQHHNCLSHVFVGGKEWQLSLDSTSKTVPVHGGIASNDASVLLQAVLANLGISMLPTYLVGPYLRSGKLTVVLPSYRPADLGIYAVYLSRAHMPLVQRALIDFLSNYFNNQPNWDQDLVGELF